MNAEQLAVEQFMKSFGQKVRTSFTWPPEAELSNRLKMEKEEDDELHTAIAEKDRTGVADALGDKLYVLYGHFCAFGIDASKVLHEIHRSNMSKFWKSNEVAVELNRDAQEIYQYNSDVPLENDTHICRRISKVHWVVTNKEGKIIKSPSYSPANIASTLS